MAAGTETFIIIAVVVIMVVICVYRMLRPKNAQDRNELGQPLLGQNNGQPLHESIRAHLAAPNAPPMNLRQWGMTRSSSSRHTLFRASTVLRATAMGGDPVAAGRSYIPDESAITFVNVRALDLEDPKAEVVWMPVYEPSFLQPNTEEGELPAIQRPHDALATRTVWWVRRGQYKIRSDDAQIAEILLERSVTLSDISELPFETKQMWLRNELDQRTSPGVVNIMVTRDQLAESMKNAFREMLDKSGPQAQDMLSRKFMYAIKDETEFFQDVGGITRELYGKVFTELFAEERGLFMLSADEDTYVINPARTSNAQFEDFYFVGLLMGKMLLDGLLIPAHLSLVLRKRLLDSPIKFQDLQGVDYELWQSLEWVKDNSVQDVIFESFCFTQQPSGELIELKPGGANIEVNDENKIEWITLRVRHALLEVAKDETAAIKDGLYDVIPPKLLSVVSPSELEFLLSGLGEIEVSDWQCHTVYKNCSPSTPQVKWFWSVVSRMSNVERCKLLSFATGCGNLPVEGFAGLRSARGVSRMFQVSLIVGASARLPQAHTCFNTLDLPDYGSEEELNNKLRCAMEEGAEGFFVAE